jgi:hypothetical protein
MLLADGAPLEHAPSTLTGAMLTAILTDAEQIAGEHAA